MSRPRRSGDAGGRMSPSCGRRDGGSTAGGSRALSTFASARPIGSPSRAGLASVPTSPPRTTLRLAGACPPAPDRSCCAAQSFGPTIAGDSDQSALRTRHEAEPDCQGASGAADLLPRPFWYHLFPRLGWDTTAYPNGRPCCGCAPGTPAATTPSMMSSLSFATECSGCARALGRATARAGPAI